MKRCVEIMLGEYGSARMDLSDSVTVPKNSAKMTDDKDESVGESCDIGFSRGQWRIEGGLGCSKLPPTKFRRPSKIVPNSTRL